MKIHALDSIFFDKKYPAKLDTLIDIIDFNRFERIDLVIDNLICYDIWIGHLVDINEDNDLVVTFIDFDFINNETERLIIRLFIESRDKKKIIHI